MKMGGEGEGGGEKGVGRVEGGEGAKQEREEEGGRELERRGAS